MNVHSMSQPLVSVAMPVYRQQPALAREAVESVLRQTFSDFEFIIVEDPSEQTLEGWIQELGDARIRYYLNPHRTTLVQQRQQALELARGEFVAVFDSDDVCEPQRLQKQFHYLEHNPQIDVLGSQLIIIDGNGRPFASRNYPLEHDQIMSALPIYCPLAQPAVMFRRQAVLAAGGYEYGRYFGVEDYELWCRLAKRGAKFANLDEALLRYRMQPGQLKAQRLRDQLRGTLDIKCRYWRDEMTFRARMRLLGERWLLWLPAKLIMKLFTSTAFRRYP